MKRHFSIVSIALTLLMVVGSPRMAIADSIPEYDMKAAYLYNFATFTSWPNELNGNIRLCVLGNDSFKGGLSKLTQRAVKDHHIVLTYLPNVQTAAICQILFIDSSERAKASEIMKQLEYLPVLTVTDDADLFNAGVMMGLFVEDKRLSFDVNYAQTKNAKLVISSKLLRVARKVLQ